MGLEMVDTIRAYEGCFGLTNNLPDGIQDLEPDDISGTASPSRGP